MEVVCLGIDAPGSAPARHGRLLCCAGSQRLGSSRRSCPLFRERTEANPERRQAECQPRRTEESRPASREMSNTFVRSAASAGVSRSKRSVASCESSSSSDALVSRAGAGCCRSRGRRRPRRRMCHGAFSIQAARSRVRGQSVVHRQLVEGREQPRPVEDRSRRSVGAVARLRVPPVAHATALAKACPMTPTALAHIVTDSDPVRRWRLDELERAGYAPYDALVLSGRPDVDLHLAVRLLRQGCPPETALRIFL